MAWNPFAIMANTAPSAAPLLPLQDVPTKALPTRSSSHLALEQLLLLKQELELQQPLLLKQQYL